MLFKWLKPGSRRSQSSSSSSNSSGRLFVLPYDLLEEIATTYFSRREAAALLTVNSQFHVAFSRALWRTLDASRNPMQSIPGEPWRKYGHLVRCMSIETHHIHGPWLANLSNLTELTLNLTDSMAIWTDRLELLSLRRIRAVAYKYGWKAETASAFMDLAQHLEQKNKSLLVQWDLILREYEHVAALNTIINRVDDTDRHSFSIAYLTPLPLIFSQFSKLSRMLVKVDVGSCFSDFRDFFLHCSGSENIDYTFSRLTTLRLHLPTNMDDDRTDLFMVTPVRFPSLTNMQIKTTNYLDHLPGFSDSTDYTWFTITELRFQSSLDSNNVNQALKRLPNLERLVFEQCMLDLDMTTITEHLPRLRYFEFGSKVQLKCSNQHNAFGPVVSIKEVVFRLEEFNSGHYHYVNSTELLLKFIFRGGAPNLHSLEFGGQKAVDWKKYTLKQGPQVNMAVRTLILHSGHDNFNVPGLPELRTMFPNLKFLKLRECTDATRKKLVKRYPYLIITVEPI